MASSVQKRMPPPHGLQASVGGIGRGSAHPTYVISGPISHALRHAATCRGVALKLAMWRSEGVFFSNRFPAPLLPPGRLPGLTIIPLPPWLSAAPVGSASGAVRPPREAGGAPTGARPVRARAVNPISHLNPKPLHLLPLYRCLFFFFRIFLFSLFCLSLVFSRAGFLPGNQ